VDMRTFTESKDAAVTAAKGMPGVEEGFVTVLCIHPNCFDDYLMNAIPDEPIDE
jgi:hypothetical protein